MTEPVHDPNHKPESTPHGPHPESVDEASGGADSSPFEAVPSGEKAPAAREERGAGRPAGEPPPR